MIPLETQIFRLIFPPSGSIPLEKIEAVPHIRQHINSIIDLASTEHGISPPDESAALTARVIELRDTPGPDGKIRTWRTIAEICGTTLDAARHRYVKGKATIRKSRTVRPSNPPFQLPEPDPAYHEAIEHPPKLIEIRGVEIVDAHNIACEWGLEKSPSESTQADHPQKTEAEPLQEAEPANLEKPAEPEKKPDEVATIKKPAPIPTRLTMCGDFTTVRGISLAGKPIDAVGVGGLEEPPEALTPCQRGQLVGPKIPHELDDELIVLREAGNSLKEIVNHLRILGIKCTEADVSARVLSEQRKRAAAKKAEEAPVQEAVEPATQDGTDEEPQEAEATDDRPEPVSMSRKELDLRIWDMWRAGKTLEEISDILYSKGLYYSPKSVRVRLLSQGAKL